MYQNSIFAADETTISGLVKVNWRQLLGGFGTTLKLALVSFAFALIIGAVLGTISSGRNKFINTLVSVYINVTRGIPLMVLAFSYSAKYLN
ncbi:MAG: ABC transporter permease subunit [Candidatus Ancillula trichonymphae]|jgi:polar amino acid transport system substrate-binding protein|nr:ABC transporter permease subunit [Candidatus Ancillula trichonymphae]